MDVKEITVKDIFELCEGNCPLQVVSAYNGKLLCHAYKPEKHTHISNRIVYDIRPAIKVQGYMYAFAFLEVSVRGREEYEEEQRKKGNK